MLLLRKISFLVCVFLLTLFLQSAVVHAETPQQPTLDVMIGSMIMCGFRGTELLPGDPFLDLVAKGHVGHVILFDRDVETKRSRNIVSRKQVQTLVQTLKNAAHRSMLIAVDQEGGRVCRLKKTLGFQDLPSPKTMGRGSLEKTELLGRRTGEDMRMVGLNTDFAPTVDVMHGSSSVMGRQERSFSADAAQCAEHAWAFGKGLMAARVIPTLKHFPGLGCATDDTHFLRADTSTCFAKDRDLFPYVYAFRHGWAGMVMVSHVHSPFDATYPASLSSAVIHTLLRQKLGWQGVVISDDLQMGAISKFYSLKEAVLLAVQAGTDILLFGNNLNWQPDMAEKAFQTLTELVQTGQISEERIRASYIRIQTLLQTFSDETQP